MMKANLIASKERRGHDGPPSQLEPATSNSDEWISDGSTPLRRIRHLDVDEVLARSLPKVGVNRDGASRRK